MQYTGRYNSPLGGIFLAADETGLTGLWFEGQKYFASTLADEHEEKETQILTQTKKWLDIYFSGRAPDFTPPLSLIGTDFQKAVWRKLLAIPYGQTTTYGTIAAAISKSRPAFARAVGGAVGHNPISIIVPCHRVLGAGGKLTGYAGGVDKKLWLLRSEGVRLSHSENQK